MTFDEVLDEMNADQEPSESIRFMERLRDIYAPTIEMTQSQYDIFNSALAESKGYKNDFIYFIDGLEIQSRFNGGIFENELSAYRNDSRYLMQAWLHPETIKVVDNDV